MSGLNNQSHKEIQSNHLFADISKSIIYENP